MKNFVAKFGFSILVCLMTTVPFAQANYYNFGTLDVRPAALNGRTPTEWFVEYLSPGSQKQQAIQVSNFSSETKDLSLYVSDTDTNEGTSFFAKSLEQNSEDIASWVNLPTNKITLQSGESRIVSVNFKLPKNAGVGLHTAAVIVRENKAQTEGPLKNISIEKGVRVYLNVTGPAITEGHVSSVSTASAFNSYLGKIETKNTGTTDLASNYRVELTDLLGGVQAQNSADVIIKPQTSKTIDITMEAPKFGFYQTFISNGTETSFVNSTLFVPLWSLLLTAGIALAIAKVKVPKKKSSLAPAFNAKQIFNTIQQTFSRAFNSLELRRSMVYCGMLTIAAVSTLSIAEFDPDLAKSQLLTNQPALSYDMTVKWGNFRSFQLPEGYRKQWHGRLYFPNARISTLQLLHFERNDEAEIVGDSTALRFNALTGPDNDGLVLKVEPTGDEIPIVRYENFDTDETYEFQITDFLGSEGIYPDGLFSTLFKTEYGEEERLHQAALEEAALTELEATAEEIEATPAPVAQIPELENLFIEDLPATPEVLQDFVLTSDYVGEIVEENSTATVETDSILIDALQATPEVLQEIAASPNLNFVFVPTETINFPPQEFSFKDQKTTEQDLGTLIFVQNKETPWNTYVATTDFHLLSGKAVIPASAMTIMPGEPILLNGPGEDAPQQDGSQIDAGNTENFTNPQDKNTLVTVNPDESTKEVFALRPKLSVHIPPGTPAGTYQGSLTITSL